MKKYYFLLLFVIISINGLYADLYIKEEVRIETVSGNEVEDSKVLGVNETWLSGTKMKIIEGSKIMIIDITVNKLWFANSETKTYLEADLPLNFKSIFTEKLQEIRDSMFTTGEVESLSETKNICGKKCNVYTGSYWHPNLGKKEKQAYIKVWATDDVNINLTAFDQMILNLRKVYNRDEKLIDELGKIKGIQMRVELRNENIGADKRYVSEVFEITEKETPVKTYILDKDYVKKEILTPDDFK